MIELLAANDALKAALIANVSIAGSRVYVHRMAPLDDDRNSLAGGVQFPCIVVYLPVETLTNRGGRAGVYDQNVTWQIECWAEIDPGRAEDIEDADEVQIKAVWALAAQARVALMKDATFLSCIGTDPDFRAVYGSDRAGNSRAGAAVLEVTAQIRTQLFADLLTGDLLETIHSAFHAWDEVNNERGAVEHQIRAENLHSEDP